MTHDQALAAHVATWDRKLRRLQRAHPARWHVPGLSDDEVRDAITLRMIELFHEGDESDERGLSIAKARVAELRRAFRIRSTPMDLREAIVWRSEPSEEEQLLEREADAHRASAQSRAEAALNRPQRRWLAAMREAASQGDFFASSAELNLSAVSRLVGKHRSSAARAYDEIRARFAHALASE